MSPRVAVRRAAELDIQEAEDWYEARRPGLGTEFRAAIDERILALAGNPFVWSTAYRNVRRAKVQRFPYFIWYLGTEEHVVILACVHARRDPAWVAKHVRSGRPDP